MAAAPLYEGFLPGRHPLEGYGSGGFRFGGMSHRGSLLALPSGIHAWSVTTADDITEATLGAVLAEAGALDMLLLGTGERLVVPPEPLRWRFREVGVRLDPMATQAAAQTYNILLAEGRRVAAALVAVA